MNLIRGLKELWDMIVSPKHMSVAYFGIYIVTVAGGMVSVFIPPVTLHHELGPVLTFVWGSMILVGGMIGLMSVLPGWWWLERLGIILAVTGIGIYFAIVTYLQINSYWAPGSAGSRLTQMAITILAASVFGIRWLFIRSYSFAPRKVDC